MPPRITFIATPTAHLVGPGKLKIINGRLAFTTGQGSPTRLDPAALRTVLCYGGVGVTDEAMAVLLRHRIEVAWLSQAGHRCHGRLVGYDGHKTALRIVQHRVLADEGRCLELARTIVGAKIETQKAAARHAQRHGASLAGPVLRRLDAALACCASAPTLDVLRGLEGDASAAWYELLGNLLISPWAFTRRTRRPPTDPVNALLSLGYTFLLSRTSTRCEALGLEVALGALHAFRPGRPSLACDLIEPLRVPAVDRWVIALCNEGHIAPDDFLDTESSGVRLQQPVFPRILAAWEKHWLNGGIETIMEQTIEDFIQRVRRLESNLPTLDREPPRTEGLGSGAS